MTRQALATWPERFVYVCAASQGAMVNHAPLHHAGADRLVGLVILRALSTPNDPSGQDRASAKAPADRLRQTAMDAFDLPAAKIRTLSGHADLLAPWADALRIAADMARQEAAAIVFNITGGRKPTTLGALLGAPKGGVGPALVLVSVGLDGTIRRIDLAPDGHLDERPLPARPGLGLEVYLGSYGMRMLDPEARLRGEARLLRHKAAYQVIAGALPRAEFRDAFADTQARVAKLKGNPGWRLALNAQELLQLRPLIEATEGARVQGSDLVLQTQAARGFLSGYWLEGMALAALRRNLPQNGPVHLARAVEVAGRGAPRGKTETDFDLMLLQGNRLGLVECKAGRDITLVRRGLVHLSHYRAHLAAEAGRAWLLAPLAKAAEAEGLLAQAEALGVTLLTGPQAIAQLQAGVQDWTGLA